MPIATTDLQFRLSGGSSNTNTANSLGGAISSTAITSSGSSGIFDDVTSAEKASGKVEYRCFYVRNNDPTRTAFGLRVYMSANTPSTTTTVEIGLGTSAINGSEPTVADEATAPVGVTFSAAAGFAGGLVVGDLAPLASKAVWARRTVDAGSADAVDTYTFGIACDSNP